MGALSEPPPAFPDCPATFTESHMVEYQGVAARLSRSTEATFLSSCSWAVPLEESVTTWRVCPGKT